MTRDVVKFLLFNDKHLVNKSMTSYGSIYTLTKNLPTNIRQTISLRPEFFLKKYKICETRPTSLKFNKNEISQKNLILRRRIFIGKFFVMCSLALCLTILAKYTHNLRNKVCSFTSLKFISYST